MTNYPTNPTHLANEFGVDDLDSIADDLYEQYLEYCANHPLDLLGNENDEPGGSDWI